MKKLTTDERIVNKYTDHLRKTILRAAILVRESANDTITPEHLFLALIAEKGAIGCEVVRQATAHSSRLQAEEQKKIPYQSREWQTSMTLAEETKRVLLHATALARQYGHCYIGTEHLLESLLTNDATLLKKFHCTERAIKRIKNEIAMIMKSAAHFTETHDDAPTHKNNTTTRTLGHPRKSPMLDTCCRDLTALARAGKIDPVIGREKEIERATVILARRTKNNPILLGESGVGKTAIVEGLAQRIVARDAPAALRGKQLYALDVGAVVAGTIWRGQFEQRMKQLVEEMERLPQAILFIDELHTIIGAGAAAGSLDVANFLKPALARGQIRCIGATTVQDYKKTIETDPALERRFQPIMVTEPTQENTIQILHGLRSVYETHHSLSISDEAIVAAVQLAKRYFPTAMLPDKAIDLLDEAAAQEHIGRPQSAIATQRENLQNMLAQLQQKKETAMDTFSITEALAANEEEHRIMTMLAALPKEHAAENGHILGAYAVARVVANILQIPETSIAALPIQLNDLEAQCKKFLVGQDAAIATIANTVRRSYTALHTGNRPRASFLFVGPSGVGKTALSRILAQALFPDEAAYIRIDMGEFTQSFQMAKLIGAPPGYVGYRESTSLADAVKKNPASVVVFDEIEKAHPEVLSLILGLLDSGIMTDATGKKINFSETTVICTSNIGTREQSAGAQMGFVPTHTHSDAALQALIKKILPIEFVNRIDAIVPFRTLERDAIFSLVTRTIQRIEQTLAKQSITLLCDADVSPALCAQSYVPDEGARAVFRVMNTTIENPIAERLCKTPTPSSIRIAVKNGMIVIE